MKDPTAPDSRAARAALFVLWPVIAPLLLVFLAGVLVIAWFCIPFMHRMPRKDAP